MREISAGALVRVLLGAAAAFAVSRLAYRRKKRQSHRSQSTEEYDRAATRILVLGGGFGGVKTVLELDKRLHGRPGIATLLVTRDTGELFVPLLWTLAVLRAVERAHNSTDPEERETMLTFVVVGGGDTGTELAATIDNFLRNVLAKQYPWLFDTPPHVAIVERMNRILPLASDAVASRARQALERAGIAIHTGAAIERITDDAVYAGDTVIRTRSVFWAAGVNAPDVVRALPVAHERNGAVIVDDHLRIPNRPNVYVIGDAAWANDGITGRPVPALAQAAEHEARYVARAIAAVLAEKPVPPFHFTTLGEMTLLGKGDAVAEIGPFVVSGLPAWLLWHLYYLSHIGSWRNRILLASDWLLAAALGAETGELRLANHHAKK